MALFEIRQYSPEEEENIRATRLIKNVDGFDTPMTFEEEAQTRASWAEAARQQKEKEDAIKLEAFKERVRDHLTQSNDMVTNVLADGGTVSEELKAYRTSLIRLLEATEVQEMPVLAESKPQPAEPAAEEKKE